MKVNRIARLAPLFAMSASLFLTGCPAHKPVKKTWMPMGTFATITFSNPASDKHVTECFNAATSIVGQIDREMSVYKPDSEASRMNRAAGRALIPVSEDTLRTIRATIRYAELSGGAFDPTVAPLVNLWGFNHHAAPVAPLDPAAIENALRIVGFRNIVVSNAMAGLALPGMKIDFGGIAKGYAVDRAFDELARLGVNDFMVDIGGNLRVRGESRPGRPWTIGVRDPFNGSRILGTIQLASGMALATSGNYEQFVMIDGRRYTHIVDPRTGMPVTGMAGVTVLCPSGTEADGMSTALFVLGIGDARSALAALPSCNALFVPDTQPIEIFISTGMARYFTPLPSLAARVKTIE